MQTDASVENTPEFARSPQLDDTSMDAPPEGAPEAAPDAGNAHPHQEAEIALVRRIQAGETGLFGEFYQAHAAAVKAFIWRQVRDADDADDLTHETFVAAFRSINGFEGRSRVRTWLFGIARNVCLRFFRFNRRWMTSRNASEAVVDESVDARVERRVDAGRCLVRVVDMVCESGNERRARIFAARHLEGCNMIEIAEEMGMKKEAVKASLRRSRVWVSERLPEISQVLQSA